MPQKEWVRKNVFLVLRELPHLTIALVVFLVLLDIPVLLVDLVENVKLVLRVRKEDCVCLVPLVMAILILCLVNAFLVESDTVPQKEGCVLHVHQEKKPSQEVLVLIVQLDLVHD